MVVRRESEEMADLGLSLFGERPPSACSNKAASDLDFQKWDVQKPSQKYEERLFGREEDQRSARLKHSTFIKHNSFKQERCPTPKNTGKSSYVDETLFGSARSIVQDFDDKTSWGTDTAEHKPIIRKPSSSRKGSRPSTPASGRPASKRGHYKTTNAGSFVDDTLFAKGIGFVRQGDQAEFDYFGNRIISKTASRQHSATSSRPGSRGPDLGIQGTGYSSRPSSSAGSRPPSVMSSSTRKMPFETWVTQSKSEQHKILPSRYQVFNSSFVDESLFGSKPTEPDFPAPWNEQEDAKKGKPFLFDSSFHSAPRGGTAGHTPIVREKGPYLRKPIVKNPNAKPAWK